MVRLGLFRHHAARQISGARDFTAKALGRAAELAQGIQKHDFGRFIHAVACANPFSAMQVAAASSEAVQRAGVVDENLAPSFFIRHPFAKRIQ